MNWDGTERRTEAHLTDIQIELIAEKAATKAVAKMTDNAYRMVGKSVVNRFLSAVGIVTCMLITWATAKGWIKF